MPAYKPLGWSVEETGHYKSLASMISLVLRHQLALACIFGQDVVNIVNSLACCGIILVCQIQFNLCFK